MNTADIQREIARALLTIEAVGFSAEKPITFKSGIISPVYVDNRKFPFYPIEWKKVSDGFASLIQTHQLPCDVIAGIEAAGIPHSAALGFLMGKPSVFVRKTAKEHGTKKLVEGGSVDGRHVVLIEDLVTTGSSSLAGVEALRKEGATVTDCLVIVSYGLPEATEAFAQAGVTLRPLTHFPVVVEEAVASGSLGDKEAAVINDFLDSPHDWARRHGFAS
ncbi:MAG: orotate phosphoribosyltransferase [Parcubacteria group bacterium]|nr:orotate phosphoribosyltransferase [Parcubacteria group bacterium]